MVVTTKQPNAAQTEAAFSTATTLIIGLGNPIRGDDGVGWRVAEQVRERLTMQVEGACSAPEVDCASLGGLWLMERMLGYDRVILIDSIESGDRPEGTVQTCRLEDLPNPSAGHSASAHDTSLITALQFARLSGAAVPTRVEIVAIEAKQVYDFSEKLSEAVSAAVPLAAEAVLNLLAAESR
jgi:hydrogenase maturation protease